MVCDSDCFVYESWGLHITTGATTPQVRSKYDQSEQSLYGMPVGMKFIQIKNEIISFLYDSIANKFCMATEEWGLRFDIFDIGISKAKYFSAYSHTISITILE